MTHGQARRIVVQSMLIDPSVGQDPQNPSSEVDRWTDKTERGSVHRSSRSPMEQQALPVGIILPHKTTHRIIDVCAEGGNIKVIDMDIDMIA
uniref:Uncharacterized protein n=1 Tax=Solanum tuberosum TaxID=4113 RepID=M1DBF3_SOLTU